MATHYDPASVTGMHTSTESHTVSSTQCRIGPLIRSWCMQYEAKHRYLKRWAMVMGNFKKTLAMHHQRYMYYQLLQTSTGGDSQYLAPTFSAGPGNTDSVCSWQNIIEHSLSAVHLLLKAPLFTGIAYV